MTSGKIWSRRCVSDWNLYSLAEASCLALAPLPLAATVAILPLSLTLAVAAASRSPLPLSYSPSPHAMPWPRSPAARQGCTLSSCADAIRRYWPRAALAPLRSPLNLARMQEVVKEQRLRERGCSLHLDRMQEAEKERDGERV